jgi:hypothetical protein
VTTQRGSLRLGIAVAVVLALVVVVGAAVFAYWHRYPTRVRVPIHATGATSSADWAVAREAVVASDGAGPTSVLVDVTRRTSAAMVPSVRSEFDGSGGGEAVVVTCSPQAAERWTVPPGRDQWVALACDRHVEPWALHGLVWLPLEAG